METNETIVQGLEFMKIILERKIRERMAFLG